MSVKTSNTILKVMGILSIIGGILGIIISILALVGGGLLGAAVDASAGGVVVLLGLVALISSIVELLDGIFSVKAAKDNSKIQPAWVFAIVSLVFAVINLIISIVQGSSVTSSIVSIVLAILVFIAANTIKKSVSGPAAE